jgi:hypothetical protein
MGGEISLPFKSNGIATTALKKLPFDSRASELAVVHDGEYVTINYRDLQPGDVILFDMGKFDPLKTPAIARYQEKVLENKNDARWKHVGILDENFLIWDAMPSLNVRSRTLHEVLKPLSRICARRPLIPIDVDRLRDGLLALSNDTKYKFSPRKTAALAVRLLRKRLPTKRWIPDFAPAKVVCSEFVGHVLWRATGGNDGGHVFVEKQPIIIPGDFASDPEFRTIELEWCCMEKKVTPRPQPPDGIQPPA